MILCIVSLRSYVLERESLLSVCWEFVFVIMFARDDVQHAFRVLEDPTMVPMDAAPKNFTAFACYMVAFLMRQRSSMRPPS